MGELTIPLPRFTDSYSHISKYLGVQKMSKLNCSNYEDFDINEYEYEEGNHCFIVTETQAIEIRDNYATERDFWVDDMETNKGLLQTSLDTLHNKDGSKYSVKYSQNGCRLAIFCHPCQKEFLSRDPFMAHDSSRSHKEVVQNLQE